MNRKVIRTIPSQATNDGDGVKIQRVAARGNLGLLDPFLLLDEIASDEAADYIGGFPPHPHRGFETVTYMLEGSFKHEDSLGNEGHLVSGGVQWMTAGKGVIHSEMPEQTEGKLHGFQLWVNLPAKDKMQNPRYQEFSPESIPVIPIGNQSSAKVIAGKLNDTWGPVSDIATNPVYFDINLHKEDSVTIPVEQSHNVIIYIYAGSIDIEGTITNQGNMVQLSSGNSVSIKAIENAGLLFLAGQPIKEPIANWGPFVMNTREEIEQAITDYKNGELTN